MRGLAAKSDGMPLDAERPEHRAERQIEIEQHRSLFDVQFQIGRGAREFLAAFLHAFEFDPVFLQRLRKRDAALILERARFVQSRLPEQADEPKRLLPKRAPSSSAQSTSRTRDWRPAVILRVNSPQNLHPGERIQATIEPAAIRHRINMPADEERFLRFAAQGRPKISGFVAMRLRGNSGQLCPQPVPRSRPGLRKGHALRAVLVAR